jgi:hypothetical protein
VKIPIWTSIEKKLRRCLGTGLFLTSETFLRRYEVNTIDVKDLIKEPLGSLLLWRNNARKRMRQNKKEWMRVQIGINQLKIEIFRMEKKAEKIARKRIKDGAWTKVLNDTLIKKVLKHG